MVRVHSIESIKEQRRTGTHENEVPFFINGEMAIVKSKIENGQFEQVELGAPLGEMMTSETSRKELVQKVVLDVELGREDVPTLYSPIYDTIADSNLPKEFEAKWAQHGTVVFFEHLEGEEVKFGSLAAENGPIARIKGYTAGFEYTKEMELFNQTFNFEVMNKAFGEAHNAILNHLHLAPITSFNYKTANKTGAIYIKPDGTDGTSSNAHTALSLRATLRKALKDSRVAKRPGTVLLANSADKEDIEEALGSFNINATPYSATSGITDIIYYDGWETTVSKKEHSYQGVPQGKAFLVRPKRGFKELIKQGLQINAHTADASRLIEAQIIGDFWRGVFAAVEENVQEITLPGN